MNKQEDVDCFMYMQSQISEFPSEKAFISSFADSIERVDQADSVQPDGLEGNVVVDYPTLKQVTLSPPPKKAANSKNNPSPPKNANKSSLNTFVK